MSEAPSGFRGNSVKWPSLLRMRNLPSPGPAGAGGGVAAGRFSMRTVSRSPTAPGYTAWGTLWRNRVGELRVAFQEVTGPVEHVEQRTMVTVVLDGGEDAREWTPLREVPA